MISMLNKILRAKKGMNFGAWGSIMFGAVGFVILGVVAVLVLASLRAGQTPNSLEYNITTTGLTFFKNIFDQLGTTGTIFGAALILSAVALIGVGGYMGYQYVKNR